MNGNDELVYQVILQDKSAIPVSKTGYEKLKEILN